VTFTSRPKISPPRKTTVSPSCETSALISTTSSANGTTSLSELASCRPTPAAAPAARIAASTAASTSGCECTSAASPSAAQ
jgi:hypothetical protein